MGNWGVGTSLPSQSDRLTAFKDRPDRLARADLLSDSMQPERRSV
jgi:hypothetical protein